MSVVIKLLPELRNSLLGQVPPGVAAHRVLETARLIRGYRDSLPLEYAVECDEQVAEGLLYLAETKCPEAVRAIDFALRLGRSEATYARWRGWLR